MLKTREETLEAAASKSGMDEKTARKYLRSGKLPSQSKVPHTWKTRKDTFAGVWEDVRKSLGMTPGLEAKTIFEDLQRTYEGIYADGQLRTLQQKVKCWRALEGPGQEYGRNARRLGEESFSREKLASEFVNWLEDVHRKWEPSRISAENLGQRR
jgi:hypothetical protein